MSQALMNRMAAMEETLSTIYAKVAQNLQDKEDLEKFRVELTDMKTKYHMLNARLSKYKIE